MRRAIACLAGALTVLLVATMNEPVQAADRPRTNDAPHAPKETPLAVRAVPAKASGALRPQTKPTALRSYAWPAAREATVTSGGKSTLPVAVTPTADVPKVRIAMRGQDDSARLGLTGVLFEVGRADGRTARGSVRVAVDASPFEAAIGGGWASRLHLVSLPNCALTTPHVPACRTATALPGSQADAGHVARATVPVAAAGTLVALVAGASGSSGSYAATPLGQSSSWGAGTQSGSFTWSYPLRVPPGVNGPEPQLAISYDSGSVDGRTAASNAQPTWLGEGFALGTGYIERSYASCQDDQAGGNNGAKTGDLCWKTDTVNLSLAGHSGEIIKDGSTGAYRMVNDDGSRIERLTGATNSPDNDGEYWKLTTSDGTQYFFGRTKRYASDTQADTGATWTVPVAGNQAGEPCHATAFKDSFCTQAWRWNIDYVVDPHGNTMSYTYARESNRYQQEAEVAADAKSAAYTASGYLTGITYGTRAGAEANPAPARVVFGTAERCLPDAAFACTPAQLTSANAARWPDVPFDQICASTSSCGTNGSPSFFSRKRLTSVTTQVITAAGGYADVDQWSFAQDFYDPADSSADGLELTGITHTGKYGTSAALPSITFGYEMFRNRVSGLTDGPTMYKPRLTRVINETGGEISPHYDISLGAGHLCSSTTLPSSPAANGTRCYPSYWTPEGASSPTLTWFYKYVVDQVGEKDLVGGAVDTVTSINYVGGAAWKYDDSEITPAKYRTWSDWRGYGTVEVGKGDANTPRTLTRTIYLRGMDGTVTDSKGGSTVDAERLAGSALETSVYNGSSLVSTTISKPSIGAPTATAGSKKAAVVGPGVTDTYTPVYGGSERHTRVTVTTDPAYGTTTQVDDEGDVTTTADDLCTRYGYVRNTTAWITAAVSEERQVGVACSVASPAAGDLLNHSRTSYDGGVWGAAPAKGLATQVDELQTAGGGDFGMRSKATYDAYGRVQSSTDAMGRTTATAYTQLAIGGQSYTGGTIRAGTTDPKGFVATSEISPAWGLPVSETDINGKVTSLAYDGLGRLTAVWTPSRARAAFPGTPSMKFGYSITKSAPSVVSTHELLASAVEPPTYLTGYQIFDGMLRARQTQSREASGQGGRIITENEYDSRGLAVRTSGPYYATGSPSGALVQLTDVQKGSWHQITYDQAERPVLDVFMSTSVEKFRTTTSYGGSFVSVDPPDGQQPTTTWVDARGRTTAVWRYHGNTPTSTLGYDETRYGYDRSGHLTHLTAPNGAKWDYTYDLRGRLIRTDDPDRGVTTMTYNANDQVTTSTDARGSTIWTDYDVLGRVTQTRKNDANGTQLTARAYDSIAGAKGKPVSTTRYANGNAYTSAVTGYDEAYRPTGGTLTIPAAEGALAGVYRTTNTYTGNGSLATTDLPAVPQVGWGAETLSVGYDANVGNQSSLASGSVGSIVNAVARSSYGEGLIYGLGQADKDIWFGYAFEEGTRRLVAQTAQRRTGTGYDVNLTYAYDKGGNVTSTVDAAPAAPESQCYTYDYAAQLTAAWTPAQGTPCSTAPTVPGLGGPAPYWHSYTYDNGGNRRTETVHSAFGDVSRSYTYAPVSSTGKGQPHTLTKVDSTAYTYDATGNTKTIGGKTLNWDEEGHLASTADSSYVYDADGDRLIRNEGAKKTLYLDNTEVQVDTSTGAVTATRYYEFDGRTVAMRQSGGGLRAVLSDNQGSPIWTVDFATTADTRRRRYYPFGAERVGFSQVTWPGERGYVDGVKDAATGTTHLGAREYDPATARFLSVDPLMDTAAPNPYAYSRNNPITLNDADGLEPGSWCNTPACTKHDDDMKAGKAKPCMGMCYSNTLSDHDVYKLKHDVLSDQVNAARQKSVDVKKRLVEAAKKLGKVLMDELGITAGLDCFTKGDLGACAETAVNVLMSSIGSMAAKAVAKYAMRWGKAKAVGKLLWKLARDIYSGVKGFFKTQKDLRKSEEALEHLDEAAPPPPSSSCNSFTADTKVLTADGRAKPIKDIKLGDKVRATDPRTGKSGAKTVTALLRHTGPRQMVDVTVSGGGTIRATNRHPFYNSTTGTYTETEELRVTDRLRTPDGRTAPIFSVRTYPLELTSYNLTVADLHTYYVLAGAIPVLVHNANTCDITPAGWQHVKDFHRPGGVGVDKSKGVFTGTDAEVQDLIHQTVRRGQPQRNTQGRDGTVYEWDFARKTGTKSENEGGGEAVQVRVVVNPDGTLRTANPY